MQHLIAFFYKISMDVGFYSWKVIKLMVRLWSALQGTSALENATKAAARLSNYRDLPLESLQSRGKRQK